MKTTTRAQSRLLALSACCLAAIPLGASAATTFTGSVDESVTDAGNWDNGLPDNVGNSGTIPTGLSTTYLATGDLNFNGIWEGNSILTGPTVRLDDGELTFNDTSSYTSAGVIALGRDSGAGVINVNDNATILNTGDMKIGRAGNGTINQAGGNVSVTIDLELGNDGSGRTGEGFYNLSGGTAAIDGVLIFKNASVFDLAGGGILEVGNGGADYTTALEGFINSGQITLNGAPATTGDFQFGFAGGVTSLQAIPEPSAALLGLLGMAGLLRRRR